MNTTRCSLLLRIRDPRDRKAGGEFDALYRPMLLTFARALGLDVADAEDVVQHCMLAITKHIRAFDYDPKNGRFKGWLRTLVNNRVRNMRRVRVAHQQKTGDFERPQNCEPLPEDRFEELWIQQHLRFALGQIREEVEDASFQAYRRYVMNGEPVSKVCSELNLNANQLYAIKFRISRKLHEKMKVLLDGTSDVEGERPT